MIPLDYIRTLFEKYLSDDQSSDYVTPISKCNEMIRYHRLDMIAIDSPFIFFDDELILREFSEKKDLIISKNDAYCNEIKLLGSAFQQIPMNYSFLKGSSLILNFYKKPYHRYFGDVDLLISPKDIGTIEKTMLSRGYVYGDYISDKIVGASRKSILHHRVYTHELYNMVKIIDSHIINIDINFKFSWSGMDASASSEKIFDLNKMKQNILTGDYSLSILKNEYQFVHLCSHFYNEAIYFVFDPQYISGTDPQEILLFRLLDILIVSDKEIDIEIIHTFSLQMDCVYKVEYVISLIQLIMGDNYTSKFSSYFDIESIFPNYFYKRNGEKKEWPISIEKRLFDFNDREQALNKLASEGCI